MTQSTNKKALIRCILQIEWSMFQRVKSATPAPCQLQQEAFERIRSSVYETWTEEALESCRLDFEQAQLAGRNLCTEKYACMDGLIWPHRNHPLIDKIVEIETGWQDQIRRDYPALYNRVCRSTYGFEDGRNFSVYLACEIRTYSERTIQLYYLGMKEALERGENLALKSLDRLVRQGGYRDVAHAEQHLASGNG